MPYSSIVIVKCLADVPGQFPVLLVTGAGQMRYGLLLGHVGQKLLLR